MRIVFMGTPDFAVPSLQALIAAGHEIVAVCCQPDRPRGRGGKVQMCPAKECALASGIPVIQYERLRRPEAVEALQALAPDLFVTAAFGQILSRRLLAIPRLGTVNVHASLLPKYRGSAPVNWSLICGEETVGVTTMMTDIGMDTGDMLLREETQVLPGETAGELTERLSVLGAGLLVRTLEALAAGTCPRTPQREEEASYYPMLEKTLGDIDWTRTAREVDCLVRGVNPWPGAYTHCGGAVLKVWKTAVTPCDGGHTPGEVILSGPKCGLVVACAQDAVEIVELQSAGSRRMRAKDYLLGHPIAEGTILTHATEEK
jgi:methionyl-tRNA formyltransferase